MLRVAAVGEKADAADDADNNGPLGGDYASAPASLLRLSLPSGDKIFIGQRGAGCA